MPKRYTPDQKQEALRLLAVHKGNVPAVHHLTGISLPTLYRWRRQELSRNPDFMTQKNIPSIENHSHKSDSPPPAEEPQAGVPGRTYPYPLADEESDAEKDIEDFRNVRNILMNHAQRLAASLDPDDPDINRRSLALSRILERVHQLDDMLPSLLPEQIMRYEFVYDGMVHDKPPWKRTEADLLAQLEYVRKK